MAVSTLNVSFTDLRTVTGRELGYGPAVSDWSSDAAAVTHVDNVVKTGLRRVYGAHDWNWLRVPTTITVWGSITGTISTVGGTGNKTITASASVFYPTCVGKTLVADTSENEYTVATYISGTQITVTADASADALDTFTITADGQYPMPDDFGGLDGEFFFQDGTSYHPLKIMGQAEVLRARAQTDMTGIPLFAAVRWVDSTNALFQACEVMMYPTPDAAYVLNYRYRKLPNALVTTTAEYPYGHSGFSELFRVACLAAAEEDRGIPAIHSARYQALLAEAIARDGRMTAQTLGTQADWRDNDFYERSGRTKYNGSLP